MFTLLYIVATLSLALRGEPPALRDWLHVKYGAVFGEMLGSFLIFRLLLWRLRVPRKPEEKRHGERIGQVVDVATLGYSLGLGGVLGSAWDDRSFKVRLVAYNKQVRTEALRLGVSLLAGLLWTWFLWGWCVYRSYG